MIDKSIRQYYDNGTLVKKRADGKRPGYAKIKYKGHPIYGTERPEEFSKQRKFEGRIESEAERAAIHAINPGYLPYMEERKTAQIPYGTGEFDWMETDKGSEIFPRTELGSDLQKQMYHETMGFKDKPDRVPEEVKKKQTRDIINLMDRGYSVKEAERAVLGDKTPIRQAGETPEKFESTAQRLKTEIEQAGGIDYVDAILRGETGIQELPEGSKIKDIVTKGKSLIEKQIKNTLTPKNLVKTGLKKDVINRTAKKLGLGSMLGLPGLVLGWLFDKAKAKVTGKTKTGITKALSPKEYLARQERDFQEGDPDCGVGSSGNVSFAGIQYDKKHGAGAYKEKTVRDRISNIVRGGSTSQSAIDKINRLSGQLDYEHEGAIVTTDTKVKPPYVAPIAGGGADVIDRPEDIPFEHEGSISITPPPRAPYVDVGTGGQGGSTPGDASRDPTGGSPFYKGGRIDKALTGRSRDI